MFQICWAKNKLRDGRAEIVFIVFGSKVGNLGGEFHSILEHTLVFKVYNK